MKKLMVIVTFLLGVSSSAVYSQTGITGGDVKEKQRGETKQQGVTGEGMMPIMQQMMGQHIMMRDMMQMMVEMMKVQENMLKEMKPPEKEKLMMEMDKMMEEMDKMMATQDKMMEGMRGMMAQGTMGGTEDAGAKKEEQKGGTPKTQEKTEAGVTAKAAVERADGTVSFRVALDTHKVDLDRYKFEEIVSLRAGGKEYKPRVLSQGGSGHHRSAVIEFDNPRIKEVELVVKGVAGVKERIFKFTLEGK